MDGPKILEVAERYRKHFVGGGIWLFVLPKELQVNSFDMRETVGAYRAYFEAKEVRASDFPHEKIPGSKEEILAHCHGMLGKMENLIAEGRREKTLRWFGFIQGCVWSTGQDRLSKEERLSLCHVVPTKIEYFVSQDRMDEAFLWLGFAQGCLWSNGVYPLDDLRDHSRPDGEPFKG